MTAPAPLQVGGGVEEEAHPVAFQHVAARKPIENEVWPISQAGVVAINVAIERICNPP
jgi:hypothetical protein